MQFFFFWKKTKKKAVVVPSLLAEGRRIEPSSSCMQLTLPRNSHFFRCCWEVFEKKSSRAFQSSSKQSRWSLGVTEMRVKVGNHGAVREKLKKKLWMPMLPGIDLPSSRYSLTDGLRNTLGKSGDSSSSIWSLSILWSGSRTAGTLATRGGLRARFERMFCCGRWCSSEPSVMKRWEYVCVHLSDLKKRFLVCCVGWFIQLARFCVYFSKFWCVLLFSHFGLIPPKKNIDGEKLIACCEKSVGNKWRSDGCSIECNHTKKLFNLTRPTSLPCTHLTQMSARVHQKMFYKSNEQEKLAKTATFQQQFTLFFGDDNKKIKFKWTEKLWKFTKKPELYAHQKKEGRINIEHSTSACVIAFP